METSFPPPDDFASGARCVVTPPEGSAAGPLPTRRPVGSLRPGDHAWLPYSCEEERRHVVGAFVREGLATGHNLICLAADDAEEAVPGGAVEGVPEGLLTVVRYGVPADPRHVAETLVRHITLAEEQGHLGVRVTVELTWAVHRGLDALLECERSIERAVGPDCAATVVCQFDRRRCGPEELNALRAAHAVVASPDPEFEDSVLRIERTFRPPGLALWGELDASRHTALDRALSSILTSANGLEVHLDLSGLGFIDLGALNMLAVRAARRPCRGALVVDRVQPQVRGLLEMVGWSMLPGLRLGDESP